MHAPTVEDLGGGADRDAVGRAVGQFHPHRRRGDLQHVLGVVGDGVRHGLFGRVDAEGGGVVVGAVVQGQDPSGAGGEDPGGLRCAVRAEDRLGGLDLDLERDLRDVETPLQDLEHLDERLDLAVVLHLRQCQAQCPPVVREDVVQHAVGRQSGEDDRESAQATVPDRRVETPEADTGERRAGRCRRVQPGGEDPGGGVGPGILVGVAFRRWDAPLGEPVLEVDAQVGDRFVVEGGQGAVGDGGGVLRGDAELAGEVGDCAGYAGRAECVEGGECGTAPRPRKVGTGCAVTGDEVGGDVDRVHRLAPGHRGCPGAADQVVGLCEPGIGECGELGGECGGGLGGVRIVGRQRFSWVGGGMPMILGAAPGFRRVIPAPAGGVRCARGRRRIGGVTRKTPPDLNNCTERAVQLWG